jgi:hypothetical protein
VPPVPPEAVIVPPLHIAPPVTVTAAGTAFAVSVNVRAVPFPTQLLGVTVNVPPVEAFKETLFPEPVMVPVPLYDQV